MSGDAKLPVTVPLHAGLPPEAEAELRQALALLRSGGGRLARAMSRVAHIAGAASAPLLRGVGLTAETLQPVIENVMERAFDLAIVRQRKTARFASPTRAALAVAASGAAGGLVGLPGFLPDAAFTTLLILRNIAAIAREHGEDPVQPDTRRACLEVFMLGAPRDAPGSNDFGAGEQPDSGYFAARLMLQGGPAIALLRQAAARFGVVLSQKLAAQAVPIVGAVGGAVVNAAFLAHYRAIATAHFTIRRLEADYGSVLVRQVSDGWTDHSILHRQTI